MAPEGKTSLVVEIPCQKGDPIWSKDENKLTKDILAELLKLTFFKEEELIPFIGISFIVFKNLSRFVGAIALFNDYIFIINIIRVKIIDSSLFFIKNYPGF